MTPARGNAITSRRTFLQLLGATGATAALGGCDPSVDGLVELIDAAPEADLRPPDADSIDLPSAPAQPAHLGCPARRLPAGRRPGRRRLHRGAAASAGARRPTVRAEDRPTSRRSSSRRPSSTSTIPRQLLLDMTRAKLLRGPYSRRQLYEVMVDFWTDHLNIVSEKGAVPVAEGGRRPRRDPDPRPGPLPRPAARQRDQPGDADLPRRPRQQGRASRRSTQRELRPRAARAAHARRARRLHAAATSWRSPAA